MPFNPIMTMDYDDFTLLDTMQFLEILAKVS